MKKAGVKKFKTWEPFEIKHPSDWKRVWEIARDIYGINLGGSPAVDKRATKEAVRAPVKRLRKNRRDV